MTSFFYQKKQQGMATILIVLLIGASMTVLAIGNWLKSVCKKCAN